MATISAEIPQQDANDQKQILVGLIQAVGVMAALYVLRLIIQSPILGAPPPAYLLKVLELIGIGFAVHASNRVPPRGRAIFVVVALVLYYASTFFVYLAWMYAAGSLCATFDCYSAA